VSTKFIGRVRRDRETVQHLNMPLSLTIQSVWATYRSSILRYLRVKIKTG
jgi:hypothetical protein